MAVSPPAIKGKEHWSLRVALRKLLATLPQSIWQQFLWLLLGVPRRRRRGQWVYNSADRIWRFYLDEYE